MDSHRTFWNERASEHIKMDQIDSREAEKPYCVICPQSVMALVWALLGGGIVLAGILGYIHWVVALILASQICIGCGLKRFRRVTFDRKITTFAFALLAAYSIYRICISDEPWDTTPKCEEDIPAWNGGGRRDPGGEKVAYLLLVLIFGSLAGMPWLPSGNRYYRETAGTGRYHLEDTGK